MIILQSPYPSFIPSQLSAVKYWLDAGTITGVSDGSNIAVGNWVDQSASARGALTAAVSAIYRANGGNGRPAVEFNGTSSYCKSPSFVVAQPLYVFMVLKEITWTGSRRFIDGGSVNKAVMGQYNLTPKVGLFAGTATVPIDETHDLGYWGLMDGFFSGASSTVQVNGNLSVTGNPGASGYTDGVTLAAAGNLSGSFFSNIQIAELIIADSTLTAPQRTQIRDYLFSKHSLITRSVLVADGNSLTQGVGATPGVDDYVTQLLALIGGANYWRSFNYGVPGQGTPAMTADAVAQVDLQVRNFARKICIAWEITNDLVVNGATDVTGYNNFVTYCQGRRAAGFKVIALTVLPRNNFTAQMITYKNAINTNIRANWATFADALVDVAADSRIGDDGDENDSTYYFDGIHLKAAGYTIIANLAKPAVDALL